MSKVDGPAAIACRANFRSRNARSLFISGPATAACEAGDSSSHQDQNPRSTGSRMVAVIRRRRGLVGQQGGDVGQGDLPGPGRHRAEQGQADAAEQVIGPRPPERGVDAAEDAGQVVGDDVGVGAAAVALEHVQARRGAPVVGVEQHHPARRVFGEPGQDVGDRVAFGVDQHRAAARGGVGEHLPGEQGGFPGPGGADDPQVVPAVGDGQGDRAGRAGVGDAERAGVRAGQGDAGRRRHRPCPGPGQAGHGRVSRAARPGRPARGPTAGSRGGTRGR